jgi:hypothetical protein
MTITSAYDLRDMLAGWDRPRFYAYIALLTALWATADGRGKESHHRLGRLSVD